MSQDVLEELENYVDETNEPIATASDVAKRTSIGRRTVLERLRAFSHAGLVGTRKVGSGGRVFWPLDELDDRVQEDVDDHPPDAGSGDRDRGRAIDEADEFDSIEEVVGEEIDSEASETPQDRPGNDLDGIDLPKSVDQEAAEEAIQAVAEYLREEGSASMREIVAEIMPDHPLGYDVESAIEKIEAGDRFRGAWWRLVVKPGLEELDEIEKPPRGASNWSYRED